MPSPLLFSDASNNIIAFPLTANGNVAPIVTNNLSNIPSVYYSPAGLAFDAAANLYVQGSLGPIDVYAPGYQGPPIRTIQQGHGHWGPIAADSRGTVYSENFISLAGVSIYPPNSNSFSSSVGPIPGTVAVSSMAVDHNDELVAALTQWGTSQMAAIVTFTSSSGTTIPSVLRVLQGSNTDLDAPVTGNIIGTTSDLNVAVGPNGDLYVANALNDPYRIDVFAAGASGDVRPIRSITGASTQLGSGGASNGGGSFGGLAVDGSGRIYVLADPPSAAQPAATPKILVFAANANGNIAPVAVIQGPATTLDGEGLAISP